MSGSGLIVAKNYPVKPTGTGDHHRRKLAEAANAANAAAFTPETQLAESDTVPISLNGAGYTNGDTDLTITPYIPARAHVIFTGSLLFGLTAAAIVRITENGVSVIELPASATDSVVPLSMQALRDLEPNTTYVYAVEGLESPVLGGSVRFESGTMTLRIEARRLPQ